MGYTRKDRDITDLRKIEAKAGVIKNADGSAFFKIGNTAAYAAVYGPRDLHPKFLQDPSKGILRCNYNMMPFAGMGDRLADAGIPMKDLVAAVSVGKVDDRLVVDLDYKEEAYEDGDVADIPMAYLPSTGEISLLQMDGIISKEELVEGLKMGTVACKKIIDIQKKALKEKYKVVGITAEDITAGDNDE